MDLSRKPNLFIIGAMKSGTSSLHVYLAEHPEIFMCEPKEPSYFVSREDLKTWYPWMEEQGFWKGEDRYLALFAAAGDRKVIGESSTSYTKLPQIDGVIARLSAFAPKARFIYIMRDPVERTISHYWHMVRNRDERRDMLTAIKEESHFRDVSHYAMQLAPYFKTWGRESVHTLTTEELSGDPEGSVRRIFAWLGVSQGFVPKSIHTPEHVTPEELRQAKGWAGLFQIRQSGLYRKPPPDDSRRSAQLRERAHSADGEAAGSRIRRGEGLPAPHPARTDPGALRPARSRLSRVEDPVREGPLNPPAPDAGEAQLPASDWSRS